MRRRWRSRFGLSGLSYWLIFRGAPFILAYAVLYVANGLVIGWREAYDVNLAIISPASTKAPVLAWFLSIAGWLAIPVIAGAIAGYVVGSSIDGWRRNTIDRAFPVDEGSSR